jgi:hypothetical protein
MERFMHRFPFKLVTATAVALALLVQPPAILAQADDRAPAHGPALLDLEFPGGSALDYVNAIRAAAPSANIVVLGDLARIRMAAAKLRGVDVASALRVLDALPIDQGPIAAKVGLDNVAASPDAPPVFAVTAEIKDRGPAPGVTQSAVISLADLLGENLKSEQALSAIETALSLMESAAAPAQLKFHESTALLIARGSPEQIENIRQVIAQLRERQGTLEVRAQQAAAVAAARERMESMAGQESKARQEVDVLTRRLAEEQTRSEVLQQAGVDLRKLVSDMERELRSALAERDALMREVSDLRERLQGAKP